MLSFEFVCTACGGTFSVESARPVEAADVRCPACGGDRVRQTFESRMRHALAAWSPRDLEERRCEHFG
jgi:putative FmdB family regulatory protein